MNNRYCLVLAALAFTLSSARAQLITGPDNGSSSTINTYTTGGVLTGSFLGASQFYSGGVRVGTGDFNGDGMNDIITGEGVGGSALRVYSGNAHFLSATITPFAAGYNGGLYVAGGDINHDGFSDLIVSAGASSSRVKVLSGADTSVTLDDFFAFNGSTLGVRVASGDVNHDGFADIITGLGSGGNQIKVFSGKDLTVLANFTPFAAGYTGGLNVGAGDVDGDGFSDIIVGTGSGFAQIKVFSGKDFSNLSNFSVFPGFTGEVRVAGGDVNGDGFADIVAGEGQGGASLVSVTSGANATSLGSFTANGGSSNGIFVGAVPEPSACALTALAAAGALFAARRRLAA